MRRGRLSETGRCHSQNKPGLDECALGSGLNMSWSRMVVGGPVGLPFMSIGCDVAMKFDVSSMR